MAGLLLFRTSFVCVLVAAVAASATAQSTSRSLPVAPKTARISCLKPLDAPTEEAVEAAEKASAKAAQHAAKVAKAAGIVKGAEDAASAAQFFSYVEDPLPAWSRSVPLLHGLKLEKEPLAVDPCPGILAETSQAVLAAVAKVPNLVAKEQLAQVQVRLPYFRSEITQSGSISAAPTGRRGSGSAGSTSTPSYNVVSRGMQGEELKRALHDVLVFQSGRMEFNYRILSVPDKKLGVVLNEFRTDSADREVGVSAFGSNPRDVGFGNSWVLLAPENLDEARFRYLGEQKQGGHETFVLAFAQRPGKVTLPAAIAIAGINRPFFVQGVVWIDQSSHEIVRLQSDLMRPVDGTTMKRLRIEVEFGEVRIPQLALTLWLPKTVEVSWEMRDDAGAELHSYSGYRLFQATSRILTKAEAP